MRRTIDTNVLVRALVDEGTEESRLAMSVMATGTIVIPTTVLLETEWVLRGRYYARPAMIANLFAKLLGAENVQVEKYAAVAEALFAQSQGMDFGDALHLFCSPESDEFLTFDKALLRRAARHPCPVPVNRPA